MKTLAALIVLALLLAGGYWKAQNPDAGIDALTQQAQATLQRFRQGVDVVVEGGDPAADGTNSADAQRADKFAARLDALEASLLDVQRGNEANLAGSETTMAAVDALSASVDAMRDRLDAALDQGGVTAAPAADASASQQDLNARFAELDTRIATLAQALKTATTSAQGPAQPADPASIIALRDEINAQIANLESSIGESGQTPDVEELTQSLQATSERIESLERQVETLPASSSTENDARALRSSLQNQISELEERLAASGSSTDSELADSIKEIKAQIGQLANQSFVTRDELQARKAGRSVEYKIYFDLGSTEITPEAAEVLDSFVVQEKNRTTGVSIFGLTDRAGPAEYNQFVADKRARNVQSYLIQNGFDFARITAVTGLGEDAAASVLDDEQSDAQQRAVVLFAAQP